MQELIFNLDGLYRIKAGLKIVTLGQIEFERVND